MTDGILQALIAGQPLTAGTLSQSLQPLAGDPQQAPITRALAAFFGTKDALQARRTDEKQRGELATALGIDPTLARNIPTSTLASALLKQQQPREGVVGEDITGAPIIIDKRTGTARRVDIEGEPEQPIDALGLPERPQGIEGLDFDIKAASDRLKDVARRARVAGPKQVSRLTLERNIAKDDLENAKILKEDVITAKAAFSRRTGKIKTVIDTIDKILPKVNNLTAGFTGTALSKIPGTEARDVLRNVETVTANLGFDELTEMRQASKTGGALGQVSERELFALQATKGNIRPDQSPDQLKANLESIRAQLIESLTATPNAFKEQYGFDIGVELPQFQQTTTPAPQITPEEAAAELQRRANLRNQ